MEDSTPRKVVDSLSSQAHHAVISMDLEVCAAIIGILAAVAMVDETLRPFVLAGKNATKHSQTTPAQSRTLSRIISNASTQNSTFVRI
jgi:hypothetical protein